MLFDIFINVLDERIEKELIKFAYNTKLGGITNTSNDRLKIQKDLDRLKYRVLINKIQFSGEKTKVVHLGKKNQMQI